MLFNIGTVMKGGQSGRKLEKKFLKKWNFKKPYREASQVVPSPSTIRVSFGAEGVVKPVTKVEK